MKPAPTYEAIIQRAKDLAWGETDEQAKLAWLRRAERDLSGEEMLRKAEAKE